MPLFKYSAFNQSGQKFDGTIDADDVSSALTELKVKKGLLVKSIKLADSSQSLFGGLAINRITSRDIEYVTSEIALLLGSGVRFDKAVQLLAKAKHGTGIGGVLYDISESLKSGQSIADAFSKHDKHFDELYINLLQIGEESGALEPVFVGLADELKFKNDLKQNVIQAVTYPAVIFFVCIASIFFIFNFIVPQMSSVFESAQDLPIYTQIILGMSEWMQNYQHLLVIALVALGIMLFKLKDSPSFQYQFHQRAINFPFIGNVIKRNEQIRFCSSMALLLEAGIAMDVAVKLSAGNAVNHEFRRQLSNVSEQIRGGSALNEALRQVSFFPELFSALIEIGEESGEVKRIFTDLAQRARNDFTHWIAKFTALLEPVLILTMGLIVGGVVVVMMLSVMNVTSLAG